MRKNFAPHTPGATFREPSPPLFVATAAHVVDYQPPAPSPDHEWNPTSKRWELSAAALVAQEVRRAALTKIAALTDQQHDLVRRLILAPDEGTRTQLRALDVEIDGLRAGLAP
jgi:hypothetical protein